MKLLKPLIGALLLAGLSNSALAELKLIKRDVIPDNTVQRANRAPEYEGYLKLITDDARPYWITLNSVWSEKANIYTYFLKVENFFDGGSARHVEFDARLGPALAPSAPQQGLLALGTFEGEWSVLKLNKELTKVEKYGELKSMLIVGTTIKVGDKYLIGGQSKDKRAILIKMRNDLRIERELKVPSKTEGAGGGMFVTQSGKVLASISFTDGSEIWELSSNLAPLKKIKFPGVGAQGIPLRDGGFAVTYISLPDLDVFVERFNSGGQSVWKKKVLMKSRPFTGFTLVELQDGLGLVVGNNDRLLVARIDASGQRVQLTEDTRSGLAAPSGSSGYLIGVLNNTIHIRGVTRDRKADGRSISFHFVETP